MALQDLQTVGLRMGFSYLCVFSTYNDFGISLWHWSPSWGWEFWLKVTICVLLAGVIALMAWSTYGVLKIKGLIFAVVFVASIWFTIIEIMMLFDYPSPGLGLILFVSFATILGIGISYSSLHYKLAGIGHTELVG
ncbi:MAG: hypothetical protein RIS83_1771 [Pseudomonadota bacterium]|jgi:hypothetical protein